MGSLDSREVALFQRRVRGSAGAALLLPVASLVARDASTPAALDGAVVSQRARAPSRPDLRPIKQGSVRSRTRAKARNARAINRLLLLVSYGPLAISFCHSQAQRTTRYDLCGARLDSCQHSASSCVALAHPCDHQTSAPLLQQQRQRGRSDR